SYRKSAGVKQKQQMLCKPSAGNGGHKMSRYSWFTVYGNFKFYRGIIWRLQTGKGYGPYFCICPYSFPVLGFYIFICWF
ncbi:hypothetical protein, partial [Lachnoclostridium sp. An131]|uniref:hypothetical protein n=1 Tax=Lachnoclostridium sp. An131 TaxID=1965555 RepID=UPI0019504357